MLFIKENSINVMNLDDKNNLTNILNTYFNQISSTQEVSFQSAVNNTLVIGYAYPILNDHSLWDDILLSNMQVMKDGLMTNIFNNDLSIYDGLLSIGYATYFTYAHTGHFKKFLSSLNNYIVATANDYIQYFYTCNELLNTEFFSYSHGVAGICSYLLEFNQDYAPCIKKLLEIIISNSHNLRSRETLDLGLSNGLAGLLSTLVKAFNKGFCVEGQIQAMHIIVDIYKEFHISRNASIYWTGILTLNACDNLDNMVNFKETLSYGALSIANILFATSICLNDTALTTWCGEILLNKSRMNPKEFFVSNASLFNGYSGLLCLFSATNCYQSALSYSKITHSLLKHILALYTPLPTPTFKSTKILLSSNRITEHTTLNDYSINDGNTGIIISLLASCSNLDDLFYHYLGIL